MNVSFFEYLYRDSGNYKNWGEVIFEVASGIDLADLDKRIRDVLIDGEYFVAELAQIPTLYFQDHDTPNDHGCMSLMAFQKQTKIQLTRKPLKH